jgi:hypothetical protein
VCREPQILRPRRWRCALTTRSAIVWSRDAGGVRREVCHQVNGNSLGRSVGPKRTKDLLAFALRSFGHSDSDVNLGPIATINIGRTVSACHISLVQSFSHRCDAHNYIVARSRLCF